MKHVQNARPEKLRPLGNRCAYFVILVNIKTTKAKLSAKNVPKNLPLISVQFHQNIVLVVAKSDLKERA
jgi:hypothetical protein